MTRSSRTITAALAAVAVLSAWRAAPVHGYRMSTCGPADEYAGMLVAVLRRIVVQTDSAGRAGQDSLRLPATDSANVQLVTTESLCTAAAVLISRDIGVADSVSRMVYLIRVDSQYVAEDTTLHVGEYRTGYIMNSKLTVIRERMAQ